MRQILYFVAILIFTSCGESKPKTSAMDLLKYGMPISVSAPEGSIVESDDLGVMKDVSIKSGDDYFVQIFSGIATERDPKIVIAKLKEETKSDPYFSKIIQEDESGFIYEKKIDEEVDYDFRFVKVQGDTEFIFQTGLFGTFSEDQVRNMYNSVQ